MKSSDVGLDAPCDVSWDDMTPVAGGDRHCRACNTTVHDLSARTEAEAEALLEARRARKERLCVRYLRDAATGDVAFVPVTSLFRRAAQLVAVAAPVLLQACGGVGASDRPERHLPYVPPPSALREGPPAGVGSAVAGGDGGATDASPSVKAP